MTSEAGNPYNAFIRMERKRERSEGKLSSLRVGIKDNIDIAGMPTTAASRILQNNVATSTASVVSRMLAEGCTIEGKTNMHEFAIGATTTSTAAGPCLNPNDTSRICGGSSGGSAACVRSGDADVALGTDTGGSVRLPAAFCGVIGFKPTTGSVADDGVIPLSTTLDTVGILARRMADVRSVFGVICSSSQSLREWERKEGAIRLGMLAFGDDEVSKAIREFARTLGSPFAVEEAEMPFLTGAGPGIRRVVASYEGARYHEKWMKERRSEYFPDVLSVLDYGAGISEDGYRQGLEELKQLREQFAEGMKEYDALISPTVTEIAPLISEVLGREREYRRLLALTELFNATGSPSISLPVASVRGMPAALMLSGTGGEDMKILAIAEMLVGKS